MIPQLATDPIELTVTAGLAVTLAHGLGRQIAGYLAIWKSAPCEFTVLDPAADSSRELVLVPSGTASVRLVLL
jgi:hypothetical protein